MQRPPISVVIHGHFYQPPRENPWTGVVPLQPSAAPYHDWNERIERECYGPVTAARILDGSGRVTRRLNALAHMSFDFGPTLLSWLERQAPATYRSVLRADRESCERLDGHGNAMAMAFHHSILPLATRRDRRTEIRWAIADFRRRFDRMPEGMWLPETGVDSDTLAALAAEGIRFTVLAPHQVARVPAAGLPGRIETPEGEIAVFVYDGALSHAVAFGDLVRDGAAWAETMAATTSAGPANGQATGTPARPPLLRAIATDGETFGHHHTFAEMGLAAALDHLGARADVRVENFASFLATLPANHRTEETVELVEPSAWSCAHGVERWRSACGCKADTGVDTSQAWRAPLRDAMTWLAGELHELFEEDGAHLLGDPWAARDAFGSLVDLGPVDVGEPAVQAWLDARTLPGLDTDDRARALELLEMERDALRLFTSCAWFFDDVARVEPIQVLTYAAHAIELAGHEAPHLARGFAARLERARANDPEDGTAADIFARLIADRAAAVAAEAPSGESS